MTNPSRLDRRMMLVDWRKGALSKIRGVGIMSSLVGEEDAPPLGGKLVEERVVVCWGRSCLVCRFKSGMVLVVDWSGRRMVLVSLLSRKKASVGVVRLRKTRIAAICGMRNDFIKLILNRLYGTT